MARLIDLGGKLRQGKKNCWRLKFISGIGRRNHCDVFGGFFDWGNNKFDWKKGERCDRQWGQLITFHLPIHFWWVAILRENTRKKEFNPKSQERKMKTLDLTLRHVLGQVTWDSELTPEKGEIVENLGKLKINHAFYSIFFDHHGK
jgi:hypothetical protein